MLIIRTVGNLVRAWHESHGQTVDILEEEAAQAMTRPKPDETYAELNRLLTAAHYQRNREPHRAAVHGQMGDEIGGDKAFEEEVAALRLALTSRSGG